MGIAEARAGHVPAAAPARPALPLRVALPCAAPSAPLLLLVGAPPNAVCVPPAPRARRWWSLPCCTPPWRRWASVLLALGSSGSPSSLDTVGSDASLCLRLCSVLPACAPFALLPPWILRFVPISMRMNDSPYPPLPPRSRNVVHSCVQHLRCSHVSLGVQFLAPDIVNAGLHYNLSPSSSY